MKNMHYRFLKGFSLLTWLLLLAAVGMLLYKTYTHVFDEQQRILTANSISSTEIEARLDSLENDFVSFASALPFKEKAIDLKVLLKDTLNNHQSELDSMLRNMDTLLQLVFENQMSYAVFIDQDSTLKSGDSNQHEPITNHNIKNKFLGDLENINTVLGSHIFNYKHENKPYSASIYYQHKDLQSAVYSKIKTLLWLTVLVVLLLAGFLIYLMTLIKRLITEKRDHAHFIQNITATLQAPLTSIKESSASQMRYLSEDKLDDVKRMGSFVHAQASRLQQIVDQIQHNADTDINKKLNKREISLGLLFKHCINDMKIKYANRPVHISVSLNPEDLEMVCDPYYIKSAILNILDNALHYNEEDLELYIEISASRVHDYTIITISDNGIGVDHEELPNLKEKYYRAPQHRHIHGLGLGLYQVHQIVQAHDGVMKLRGDHTAGFAVELKFPHAE
jgi:signal transduction histidine kinase